MGPEVYLPVSDAQFLSDVVPVKFDGLGGYIQNGDDFLGGFSLLDQISDL